MCDISPKYQQHAHHVQVSFVSFCQHPIPQWEDCHQIAWVQTPLTLEGGLGMPTFLTIPQTNMLCANRVVIECINWPRHHTSITDFLVLTSVMIYHRGVSLSKQHTDLLVCHCTKQDLSCTSTCCKIFTRDTYPNSQGSDCQYGYICIN